LDEEKSTCWFGSAKWFWSSIIAQFAEAGKSHSKAPAREDVI